MSGEMLHNASVQCLMPSVTLHATFFVRLAASAELVRGMCSALCLVRSIAGGLLGAIWWRVEALWVGCGVAGGVTGAGGRVGDW